MSSTMSFLLIFFSLAFISPTTATDHIVGVNKGQNPDINYTHWANNQSFHVNDIILAPAMPTPAAPTDPIDMLLLVQSWPPGYCSSRTCNPTKASIKRFMIHGLWPVDKSGQGLPGNGNDVLPSQRFIETDSLCLGISTYWQSLTSSSTLADYRFWKYEWDKHGKADKSIHQPIDYFRKTMQLRQLPGANDPLGALKANNINPGNSYQKSDYVTALEAKISISNSVIIRCTSKGNVAILKEFFICVDRQGVKFASCNPNAITAQDNCGNKPIKFV